jgi:hypothetical protein
MTQLKILTTKHWTFIMIAFLVTALTSVRAQTDTSSQDVPTTLTTASFNIYPTENSTIEGTVQIMETTDQGTRVAVTLLNTETGQLYPAHFHDGDCGSGGEIVYPLEPLPGGPDSVVSFVDAPFSKVMNSDLYINVHQSPDNLETILACGEVNATCS